MKEINVTSYPIESKPSITWNHVDGTLLTCRDGTPHWLSLWEKLSLRAGLISLEDLDRKYNSEPQRG